MSALSLARSLEDASRKYSLHVICMLAYTDCSTIHHFIRWFLEQPATAQQLYEFIYIQLLNGECVHIYMQLSSAWSLIAIECLALSSDCVCGIACW